MGALREDRAVVGPAARGEEPRPERETKGVPLLLLEHAGWQVARADQYDVNEGEITFTNGERTLELTWRDASLHDGYVRDRAAEAAETWDVEIANRHARLFRYDRTTDFTALWMDGEFSLELRGVFPNVDAYRAVAEMLRRVDEEKWVAALPDQTVTPAARAAAVDEMLSDMPMHPDVRVEDLKYSDAINDRYQLGARVSGAVACAWIGQWVRATERGDEAAAREAEDAMATSRRWAILREMTADGGWPDVLWEYAEAMRGDGMVNGGPGEMTIAATYRDAFACAG